MGLSLLNETWGQAITLPFFARTLLKYVIKVLLEVEPFSLGVEALGHVTNIGCSSQLPSTVPPWSVWTFRTGTCLSGVLPSYPQWARRSYDMTLRGFPDPLEWRVDLS